MFTQKKKKMLRRCKNETLFIIYITMCREKKSKVGTNEKY